MFFDFVSKITPFFANISATPRPRMSPSPDGSTVILTYLDRIYKLNCWSGQRCNWKTLPNRLQIKRQYNKAVKQC